MTGRAGEASLAVEHVNDEMINGSSSFRRRHKSPDRQLWMGTTASLQTLLPSPRGGEARVW